MLHYFGEKYDEKACANMCDNCRFPKEKYNAKEHVLMVLQCVEQVHEKFGVNHMVQVLRGAASQQVILNEHDKIPIYGKGHDLNEKEWKSIFSQVIIRDFLEKDIDEYGVIKFTENGRTFLENPEEIELIRYQDYESLKKAREEFIKEDFKAFDEVLFDKLKKLCRKIAKERNIPPYVIFQEGTLEEMSVKYPLTMDEISHIAGVGAGKAAKFAKPFLEEIKQHVEENEIERPEAVIVKTAAKKSMNKLFFIQHVDRKTPLDEIANLKNISFPELMDNLEQIIYSGTRLNLDYYIEDVMDEDKIDEIYDYFMHADTDSLDIAEKELGDEFEREELQMVRAKFISEVAN